MAYNTCLRYMEVVVYLLFHYDEYNFIITISDMTATYRKVYLICCTYKKSSSSWEFIPLIPGSQESLVTFRIAEDFYNIN